MQLQRSTNSVYTGIVLSLLLAQAVIARETKLNESRVPAPVLTAFHKTYPHAKTTGFSKESEGGKTLYEVESTDGGVKRDVLYLADGTVKEIEEAIAIATLPEAVSKSLGQAFPNGKILSAEKLTVGSSIKYECIVQDGKRYVEVVQAPDGKILEKEIKSGKID